MDLSIAGRVAIVSGGSRGIGFAIAQRLADEGAALCIAARDQDQLERAAGMLEEGGARVVGVRADMTHRADVERVVATAVDTFGAVHIAVSNVSGHVIGASDGPGASHFETLPDGALRQEFDQLVMSSWYLARATARAIGAAGWGRIVNVGSRVAREPAPDLPHILPNVVRPMTAAMHRVLARELAPRGITVNSILTGSIATDRYRDYHRWLADQEGTTYDVVVADRTRLIPVGRPGEPAEIASTAAFLCSAHASWITGQAIPVDGGVNRHVY